MATGAGGALLDATMVVSGRVWWLSGVCLVVKSRVCILSLGLYFPHSSRPGGRETTDGRWPPQGQAPARTTAAVLTSSAQSSASKAAVVDTAKYQKYRFLSRYCLMFDFHRRRLAARPALALLGCWCSILSVVVVVVVVVGLGHTFLSWSLARAEKMHLCYTPMLIRLDCTRPC